MIQKIDVVFIHTPHHQLADWYAEVLGLEKSYGNGHWQEYKMEEGCRFAMDFTSFPRSAVERQSVMISFGVTDIEQTVENLASKGVKFYPSKDKAIFDVGPSLVATFQDPDGNWLQISQRK